MKICTCSINLKKIEFYRIISVKKKKRNRKWRPQSRDKVFFAFPLLKKICCFQSMKKKKKEKMLWNP